MDKIDTKWIGHPFLFIKPNGVQNSNQDKYCKHQLNNQYINTFKGRKTVLFKI